MNPSFFYRSAASLPTVGVVAHEFVGASIIDVRGCALRHV